MLVEGTQPFPPLCETTGQNTSHMHPHATTRYEHVVEVGARLLVSASNHTTAAIAAADILDWLTGCQDLQQNNPT